MKTIIRLSSQLLAAVLLQIPLFASAEDSKTPAVPADLHFASGRSALRIPFEFVGNHVYLRGRVNNSEPLWLLLDTGATASYLDLQRAKALGLAAVLTALWIMGIDDLIE